MTTFHFYSLFCCCVLCMVLTASCRVIKEVPVETTKFEYRDKLVYNTDSVYIHDSISVKEKKDTVFIEKYRTFYRDRVRTDSVFIEKSDSVCVPVIVEKKLSSFQKAMCKVGTVCTFAFVFFTISFIILWLIKRRL